MRSGVGPDVPSARVGQPLGEPVGVGEVGEVAKAAGLLGGHTVQDVTLLWDAVCTGLAMREICGPIQRSEGARIWTATLQALLAGLRSTTGLEQA